MEICEQQKTFDLLFCGHSAYIGRAALLGKADKFCYQCLLCIALHCFHVHVLTVCGTMLHMHVLIVCGTMLHVHVLIVCGTMLHVHVLIVCGTMLHVHILTVCGTMLHG